ncbi:FadR/GntR family transcriptional regulator [Salinicola peritrichatus]|uniref:FadR/GntR family transcriptional regulator n=1 Tax=Salinicola peritrichatus TaxID=1267424 RepID=UPI0013A67DD2|nr:FadR/GntR family transcriptional regulator [Salinicola peritrichatus]
MLNIDPLERKSLSDFVVAQLKSLILRGELQEGDRLPSERDLAERFRVSRVSIREGLKILSLQGLVKRTNAGTVVTANFSAIIEDTLTLKILLDESAYEEIIEARLIMEEQMIRLGATRIEESGIQEITWHVQAMQQATLEKDMDKFVLSDMAFHKKIAATSKNSVLISLYNSILGLVFKIQTQVSYDKEVMQSSLAHHQTILEALKQRDATLSANAMCDHLTDVQQRLYHIVRIENLKKGEV